MSKKTRPSKIKISEKNIALLEKHSYSNLEAEVGGMLFGTITDDGNTEIDGSIPALTAAAEQISLTFTHDVWAEILKEGEVKFPGKKIVGWYHTHPNFGIFLSEYDQFIQSNFFQSKGQLALVIDPVAGEMGWFENRPDRKVELIYKESTKTGPKSPTESKQVLQARKKNNLIGAAAIAVVSLAAGWFLSGMVQAPWQELYKRVTSDNLEIDWNYQQLQQYVYSSGTPAFYYTVKKGDTWDSISTYFYGDTSKVAELKSLNWEKTFKVGEQIFVRNSTTISVAPKDYYPKQSPTPTPSVTATPTPSKSASPTSTPTPEKKN